MGRDSVAERVGRLEFTVEELKNLPAEVRSMGLRLDGVEGRLTSVEGRLSLLESQIVQLRGEMRDGFRALEARLSERIDDTWHRTQALFEEVLDRIKVLSER